MLTRQQVEHPSKTFAGLALLGAGLVLSTPSLAEGTWIPDAKIIATLEAQIETPVHAPEPIRPLADYARFYIGVTIKGHRMVRAELVAAPRECSAPQHDIGLLCDYHAGVYVGQPLPSIFDGGCGIVNLLYDPSSGRIIWSRCNGVA